MDTYLIPVSGYIRKAYVRTTRRKTATGTVVTNTFIPATWVGPHTRINRNAPSAAGTTAQLI